LYGRLLSVQAGDGQARLSGVLGLRGIDPKRAAWLAYDVEPDGTVMNGRVFFDATAGAKIPSSDRMDSKSIGRAISLAHGLAG